MADERYNFVLGLEVDQSGAVEFEKLLRSLPKGLQKVAEEMQKMQLFDSKVTDRQARKAIAAFAQAAKDEARGQQVDLSAMFGKALKVNIDTTEASAKIRELARLTGQLYQERKGALAQIRAEPPLSIQPNPRQSTAAVSRDRDDAYAYGRNLVLERLKTRQIDTNAKAQGIKATAELTEQEAVVKGAKSFVVRTQATQKTVQGLLHGLEGLATELNTQFKTEGTTEQYIRASQALTNSVQKAAISQESATRRMEAVRAKAEAAGLESEVGLRARAGGLYGVPAGPYASPTQIDKMRAQQLEARVGLRARAGGLDQPAGPYVSDDRLAQMRAEDARRKAVMQQARSLGMRPGSTTPLREIEEAIDDYLKRRARQVSTFFSGAGRGRGAYLQEAYDMNKEFDRKRQLDRQMTKQAQPFLTEIAAKDERAGKSVPQNFWDDFKKGFRGSQNMQVGQQWGQTARFSVMYGSAYQALSLFQRGVSDAAHAAVEYTDAQTDLTIITGRSTSSTAKWADELGEAATAVGYSSAEGVRAGAQAIGLFDLSARPERVQERISERAVGVAGRIGMLGGETSIGEVEVKLAGVLRAFGDASDEITGLEDELAVISKQSGRTSADLLEGLARIGTLAGQAGFDRATTMALIARITTTTGGTPVSAADALNQVLSKADNPEMKSRLRGAGINVTGTTLAQQTAQLAQLVETGKINGAQLNQIIAAFGRGASGQAASVLLTQNPAIRRLAEQAKSAEPGTGAEQFAKAAASFGFELKKLVGAAREAGKDLALSGMFDSIGLLVKGLTELLRVFDEMLDVFNFLPRQARSVVFMLGEAAVAAKLFGSLKLGDTIAGAVKSIGGVGGVANLLTGGATEKLGVDVVQKITDATATAASGGTEAVGATIAEKITTGIADALGGSGAANAASDAGASLVSSVADEIVAGAEFQVGAGATTAAAARARRAGGAVAASVAAAGTTGASYAGLAERRAARQAAAMAIPGAVSPLIVGTPAITGGAAQAQAIRTAARRSERQAAAMAVAAGYGARMPTAAPANAAARAAERRAAAMAVAAGYGANMTTAGAMAGGGLLGAVRGLGTKIGAIAKAPVTSLASAGPIAAIAAGIAIPIASESFRRTSNELADTFRERRAEIGGGGQTLDTLDASIAGLKDFVAQSVEAQGGFLGWIRKFGGTGTAEDQEQARKELAALEARRTKLETAQTAFQESGTEEALGSRFENFTSADTVIQQLNEMTTEGYTAAQQIAALNGAFDELSENASKGAKNITLAAGEQEVFAVAVENMAAGVFAEAKEMQDWRKFVADEGVGGDKSVQVWGGGQAGGQKPGVAGPSGYPAVAGRAQAEAGRPENKVITQDVVDARVLEKLDEAEAGKRIIAAMQKAGGGGEILEVTPEMFAAGEKAGLKYVQDVLGKDFATLAESTQRGILNGFHRGMAGIVQGFGGVTAGQVQEGMTVEQGNAYFGGLTQAAELRTQQALITGRGGGQFALAQQELALLRAGRKRVAASTAKNLPKQSAGRDADVLDPAKYAAQSKARSRELAKEDLKITAKENEVGEALDQRVEYLTQVAQSKLGSFDTIGRNQVAIDQLAASMETPEWQFKSPEVRKMDEIRLKQMNAQQDLDKIDLKSQQNLAKIDPRAQGAIMEERLRHLKERKAELEASNNLNTGEYASVQQQIVQLEKVEMAGYEEQKATAKITAGRNVGGYVTDAQDAVDAAKKHMDKQKKGELAWYEAQIDYKQKQQELVNAQLQHASVLDQLSGDITDPLENARDEVRAAERELKAADTGEERDAARLHKKQADAALNRTTQSEWLSDLQDQRALDDITQAEYMASIRERIDQLRAKKTLTYDESKELKELRKITKSSAEELAGQWNIGDIRMPTPYEVRRAMKGQSGAGTAVVDNSNSNNVVQINGADFAAVVEYIKRYLGKDATVVRSNAVRKAS